MKRETKLNLIFLTAFLALSVPGAAMLFVKKLDPAAKPMYYPDPVRPGLLYIDPTPAPEGVSRIAPPKTAGWIADQARSLSGLPVPMNDSGGHKLPIMSASRLFQLGALDPASHRAWIVAWDSRLSADVGQFTAPSSSIESIRVVEVPPLIRRELQESGLPRPPQTVSWIQLRYPQGARSIDLHYRGAGLDLTDSVPLPTLQ